MASKSNEANSIEGATSEPSKDYSSTDLASLTMALDSAASENVDEEEEDEEEEDDEEEDEEEEEEVDSCESDQEWEVDSFEGVEYHSDEEDDDLEFRRYVRQCYKGEGFDVDREFLPKSKTRIYLDAFNPLKLDEYFGPPELTGRMYMERMVKVVIQKFNETKGKKLVLDHIVKTVVKMAVGVKAYITFMARESLEGELVEYQGKAEWKVWQRNIHPILCRPTPKLENAN